MRIKIRHREFVIQEVDNAFLHALCEDHNSDLRIKMDGDIVCIKFGVDKMWIASRQYGTFMVKPKTYSHEDLQLILKHIRESFAKRTASSARS